MSYFVSRDELLFEIAKAIDAVFSAVGRLFSDKDDEFNRKLKELESNFLLLINTVGRSESHQLRKKKRSKKMSEKKFEEILEDVVNHVMDSDDEELIILVDELEKSSKKFKEEKEKIEGKLDEILKRAEELLVKEKEGKKAEKATD